VLIDGARIEIERGGARDNVSAIMKRFEPRPGASGGGGKSTRRNPMVSLRRGTVRARDVRQGAAVAVEGLWVDLVPDKEVLIESTRSRGSCACAGAKTTRSSGRVGCG
jgi:hypothetical protein